MISSRSWIAAAAAAAVVASSGASAVADGPSTRHQARVPGWNQRLPAGGPRDLYTNPPQLPMLENHDPRFHAPYEMVSGTERYVDGEYLYTDYLYDDESTTYPDDWARYGGNAADLVEYRMSVRDPNELAVRFSLTTLKAKDSSIAVVAFDTDRNQNTGSSTLPKDPGLAFPGTDQVLTTWGTGAEWSRWTGTTWRSTQLKVSTDLAANQITVHIPRAVAYPTGKWSATLATGLYDPSTKGWLPITTSSKTNVVNLGFRFSEMQRGEDTALPDNPPYKKQDAALSAGAPTQFAHVLDFGLLRRHGARNNVPTHGMIFRFFASRMKTVLVNTGGSRNDPPGSVPEANPPVYSREGEGKNLKSILAQYLSPLQPYAVYVPKSYRPDRPMQMTFTLHGQAGDYYWINEGWPVLEQLGDRRDSILLSPEARGGDGFYVGDMENDVFEAWNDTARHYNVDPTRTSVTGWSMGGYGAYRLATLYPHLFSRAVPVIPAGERGMYIPGMPADSTVVNNWLPNLRNVPIFHIADMASELTFYPGQAQNAVGPEIGGMRSLESLKYRYRFRSVAVDHILMGANFPELTSWLDHYQVEPRPFHVTYVRMPATDSPELGLVHDRAYWLSGITLRDGQARLAQGTVDAVSHGFGLADPTTGPVPSPTPGIDAGGRPYLELARTWSAPGKAATQNLVTIDATNIAAITIDPVAAHVNCNVTLDIHTDGLLKVTLLGCRR